MVLSPLIKQARKELYTAVLNEQSHIMLRGIVRAVSTAYEGADVTVIFKRNSRYELLASLLSKKDAQEVYSEFLSVMGKGEAFGFDTVFRKSADSSIMIPISFNDMGKVFLIIDSPSELICPTPSEEVHIIEPVSAALRYYISTKLYYEMQIFECHDAKSGLLDRSYFMDNMAEKQYEDGYVCMIGLSDKAQMKIEEEEGLKRLEDLNKEAAGALQKVFMGLTMYSRLCFALIQEGDPYSIADKLCGHLTEHFGYEFSSVIVPIWDGGAYNALSIAENYMKCATEGGVVFLGGDERPEDFIDMEIEGSAGEKASYKGSRQKVSYTSSDDSIFRTPEVNETDSSEDIEEASYREVEYSRADNGRVESEDGVIWEMDTEDISEVVDAEPQPVSNGSGMFSGSQPVYANADEDDDFPFGADEDEYVKEGEEEILKNTLRSSVNDSADDITDMVKEGALAEKEVRADHDKTKEFKKDDASVIKKDKKQNADSRADDNSNRAEFEKIMTMADSDENKETIESDSGDSSSSNTMGESSLKGKKNDDPLGIKSYEEMSSIFFWGDKPAEKVHGNA